MAGFDQQEIFTSMSREPDEMEEGGDGDGGENAPIDAQAYRNAFKEFLREFQEGQFHYKYRDGLKKNYMAGIYSLEVLIDDVASYNDDLVAHLNNRPTEFLAIFEEAAKDLADEITTPRPVGHELIEEIQITLVSNSVAVPIRALSSKDISKLVKVSGIVLTATGVRSKTVKISLMCRGCRSVIPNITVKPGLEGLSLPRKCVTNVGPTAGDVKCPMDPYFIMPDKCHCVDFQTLKMQETPEIVPSGDMPRHIQIFADRFLCEKAIPGNRVTVLGVYSIKKATQQLSKNKTQSKTSAGVRIPYIRVLGIQLDSDASGRTGQILYTPEEETQFRNLAADPECYAKIASSIAPSIFGSDDIKKTIACLLFGGSRKRLPDGLTRRGDINVLLLGDPGTAKSQLLKFVEKVSPISIYTSGKGSSAAGLTASINRDPGTRNFVMEGGAMVLADGGVVCIDEFDKMREDDRVAIHEAMEQQTISIAKAGITTTLNSRCAVLAAANSIFGRWDDTKGDENIDFMPTIISRFDAIFIVKDEHNESRDTTLAKHVMKVHMNAQGTGNINENVGELSLSFLKKYIAYCKSRCGPRLSESASTTLLNKYILMRFGDKENETDSGGHKGKISITVRQLEAIVRMSEALAKMQLKPYASEVHVEEALRLFQVSTLDAAKNGSLQGVEGFTTNEDFEQLSRIESQLKKRFAIGALVSEQTVLSDFIRQKYSERSIQKVVQAMIRRGELQHRNQRKMLLRVK